jgi:hypothetical protein
MTGPPSRRLVFRTAVRTAAAVAGMAAGALVTAGWPEPGQVGVVTRPAVALASWPDLASLAGGSWRSVPAPPSAALQEAAVAWTGRDLVLWGGYGPDGRLPAGGLRSGWAYQPVTGRWQELPPAPVSTDGEAEAVWTGTDVVVAAPYGSQTGLAAWRPATGTWRRLPTPPGAGRSGWNYRLTWTGRQLLLYGYRPQTPAQARVPFSQPRPFLAALTADGSRWETLAAPPAAASHAVDQGFTAVWSGSRLLVFTQRMHVEKIAAGVTVTPGGSAVTSYDPLANTWTTLDATGPAPPMDGTAFWTGQAALLVGGATCTMCLGGPAGVRYPLTGGLFSPAAGFWRALRPPAALNVRPETTAWAGVLVTVANADVGPGSGRPFAVAGAWDPGSGQWVRLPDPPAGIQPMAYASTGVWTGREFLFPGGTGLVALVPEGR